MTRNRPPCAASMAPVPTTFRLWLRRLLIAAAAVVLLIATDGLDLVEPWLTAALPPSWST